MGVDVDERPDVGAGPRLFSTADAARYMAISESLVRALAARGDLPAHRLGPKLIRFRREDLDAYIDGHLSRVEHDDDD